MTTTADSVGLSGGPLATPYKVLQLHFHWGSDNTKGSEHEYDGQAYPMEVHIVHYKAAYEGDLDAILGSVDGLAVTGFMFSVGVRMIMIMILMIKMMMMMMMMMSGGHWVHVLHRVTG